MVNRMSSGHENINYQSQRVVRIRRRQDLGEERTWWKSRSKMPRGSDRTTVTHRNTVWWNVCLFVCLFVWSSLPLIHESRVRGGIIVARLIRPNHLGWVVWRRFRKFGALLHLVIIRNIINSSELRAGTRYMGMHFTRTWRISRLCRRRFIVSTASDNGTVCKP